MLENALWKNLKTKKENQIDELNEKDISDLSDKEVIEFYKKKLYQTRLEIYYLKVLRRLRKDAL
ncbi:hypothetical protein [Mycoplasma bradburyae]|uniref:Uncharacterized protein n=1 Tax=Mycoplasma bradburyae TaxID=2963128 RepID=A0ABT5GA72_9MOLU|nr:hypothetical protein [Mycoplasma bradburyae]MDC4181856.1 hypothetical protein [Mycoplasma bradburyae]UTS70155.1 hypothetical protein NMG68_00130 [Mycoplasma bradburyae]